MTQPLTVTFIDPNSNTPITQQFQPGNTLGQIREIMGGAFSGDGMALFQQDASGTHGDTPANNDTPLVNGQQFTAMRLTKAG